MNYLSVENISFIWWKNAFENISFEINKTKKSLSLPKMKTTTISIINSLDRPDTGHVVLRKGIKMAFLSQNNNLQDRTN
jgi:ATP-binding cassette subfamily F protein uup